MQEKDYIIHEARKRFKDGKVVINSNDASKMVGQMKHPVGAQNGNSSVPIIMNVAKICLWKRLATSKGWLRYLPYQIREGEERLEYAIHYRYELTFRVYQVQSKGTWFEGINKNKSLMQDSISKAPACQPVFQEILLASSKWRCSWKPTGNRVGDRLKSPEKY